MSRWILFLMEGLNICSTFSNFFASPSKTLLPCYAIDSLSEPVQVSGTIHQKLTTILRLLLTTSLTEYKMPLLLKKCKNNISVTKCDENDVVGLLNFNL